MNQFDPMFGKINVIPVFNYNGYKNWEWVQHAPYSPKYELTDSYVNDKTSSPPALAEHIRTHGILTLNRNTGVITVSSNGRVWTSDRYIRHMVRELTGFTTCTMESKYPLQYRRLYLGDGQTCAFEPGLKIIRNRGVLNPQPDLVVAKKRGKPKQLADELYGLGVSFSELIDVNTARKLFIDANNSDWDARKFAPYFTHTGYAKYLYMLKNDKLSGIINEDSSCNGLVPSLYPPLQLPLAFDNEDATHVAKLAACIGVLMASDMNRRYYWGEGKQEYIRKLVDAGSGYAYLKVIENHNSLGEAV